MNTEKMHEEFENSPRFKGMDFTRAPGHPDYYESPYANGAWDGWQASRESLVIELPTIRAEDYCPLSNVSYREECRETIEAAGLKVKP